MSSSAPAVPASGTRLPVGSASAVRVPHQLTGASWSGVGKQLKTLLSNSPVLTAGLLLVGAAGVALAYTVSQADRRRRVGRRRILRLVKSGFQQYRLDILKYVSEQPWNHFEVGQLKQILDAFTALLEDPRRGVIPISALTQIIRKSGVADEHVAHACAKFFDVDGNYQVDFVELVERLNLLVHGSKHRKLSALFSVYDLDHSGRISRDELEQVLRALGHRDREQTHEAAMALFKALDENKDGQLSKEEFLSLAEGVHAFSMNRPYHSVATHFGLLLK